MPVTVRWVAGLAVVLAGTAAPGQTDAVLPARYENPNLPQDIPAPDVADVLPPAAGPTALLAGFQFDQTYLPRTGHHKGFGVNDSELSLTLNTPWEPLGKPIRLKVGGGAHLWDGPTRKRDRVPWQESTFEVVREDGERVTGTMRLPLSDGPRILPAGPDPLLPGAVYDLYLDFGWRPRLAEWLFADLGVTPGVYGDFRTTGADFFRLRGRGLAIIALSEQFQFVAGVLYINRNQTKLIPAGGILWKPNEWTDYQLVFPVPKASKRFGVWGETQFWGYVAGEFGGGTWAVQRPDGQATSVDYNDYRVILGAEVRRPNGWNLKVEAGPVFGRELVFTDGLEYNPSGTWMVRAGLNF
jgi:hypothetical protein